MRCINYQGQYQVLAQFDHTARAYEVYLEEDGQGYEHIGVVDTWPEAIALAREEYINSRRTSS